MQIRQQYNAEIMNELGIIGEKQSDFEQKIRKIKMDTDDALGHRQEKMHIDICGLSFYLPLSLYRPIEILCKQQNTDYPFLHEKYGRDLIRALLSHYLAGDAELNKNSRSFILKQAKNACDQLGFPEPEDEPDGENKYVVQWLTYQCNKITNSFFC